MSVYTHHLLLHLPAAPFHHDYLAFQGRDSVEIPGLHTVGSPLPTVHPLVRILWEQAGLPLAALRRRVNLVHGTVNVAPLAFPGPTVVTVHDLSFLRLPDRFPTWKARYLRTAVALSARKASHIIAVSRHTRLDLVELLGVSEEKVSVVYSGVAASFRPKSTVERERLLAAHFSGRPMILHVGTLQPRKNLDLLIRAFAVVRRRHGLPHVLALVGARGWMYQALFDLVVQERLTEHVRFVDYVAPEELPLWYNSADLFAYPSAYEGFGFPVLEAMSCGVPVITTTSSSLAELVGDAGVTVPPGSQEALELAMMRVLGDEALRSELRSRGLAHAAQFSWTRTAADTAAVYDRVLGEVRS